MEKPSEPLASDLDVKTEAKEAVIRDVGVGEEIGVDYTPEQERKVVRKLDFAYVPLFLVHTNDRLIPLMGIVYCMQYMDKVALSQATLLNLREDLNLHGQEYSWASTIFYFGYFAWSWPSSYLLVRLPLGQYVGVSVYVIDRAVLY